MNNDLELHWLGTAGFRCTWHENSLLIDPYLTRNAQARPPVTATVDELFPAAAILLSHGHFDHVADVPDLVNRFAGPVICSAPTARNLEAKGVPHDRLTPITTDFTTSFHWMTVTAFPTRHVHFNAALVMRTIRRMGLSAPTYLPLLTKWPCGQPYAFRIQFGDFTMVHMGTAGATPAELAKIAAAGPVDLLLVALQGNDNIHEIASAIVGRLRPRMVLPHHQDDFYPPVSQQIPVEPFVALVEKRCPETRILSLAPGERLVLPTTAADLLAAATR
jgi:L-ascorbate metabolism protein UlaG (beta-lactamase superfamily)